MDPTTRRIHSAARAASQIGEETVRIDVAGIPVTVHAMPSSRYDSAPTRAQIELAINCRNTTCKTN